MNTFIAFSISRGMAIRQFQALFVSNSEVVDGEFIALAPDGWRPEDGLDVLVCADGAAIFDPALALSTAKNMAIEAIRTTARAVLDKLDIRHNARLGELRINRTDPYRIEAYYTTLLEQQQVRESSNAAQDAVLVASTPSAAWAIVDALNLYSAPIEQLGQNITKYAFIARLNLTHAEKQNPYIAGMQADLLALAMVNIPFVGVELKKLVGAGILTQSRVDAVLNAPIAWTERETNF